MYGRANATRKQVERGRCMSENVTQGGEPQASSTIKPGDIYDGKVLNVKPFGAIVSLPGGVPGLVHISQIANGFIENVDDVLAVGDEVVVRVVDVDLVNRKISLSMKDVPQVSEEGVVYYEAPPVKVSPAQAASFEEKLKSWQKLSSDRIAGINRRNKRKK